MNETNTKTAGVAHALRWADKQYLRSSGARSVHGGLSRRARAHFQWPRAVFTIWIAPEYASCERARVYRQRRVTVRPPANPGTRRRPSLTGLRPPSFPLTREAVYRYARTHTPYTFVRVTATTTIHCCNNIYTWIVIVRRRTLIIENFSFLFIFFCTRFQTSRTAWCDAAG